MEHLSSKGCEAEPRRPSLTIDYQRDLNPEQFRVVSEAAGPCLVLSGAGSGKTRTIIYRLARLIEQGVPADQILLLTFTNKAAKEMLSRAELLLRGSLPGLVGGTYHAVANRILRRNAGLLGYTSGFTILDQDDSRSLLKTCLKDSAFPTAQRAPSPAALGEIISFSRNSLRPLAEVLEERHPSFLPWLAEIESLAGSYERRKKNSNAMDFDDLLANLLRLLVDHPAIGQSLSSRFRHILVDEYQDTNPIQAAITDCLAGAHKNLLAVGDDAQSIYSFRGAALKNILTFPERYPGAKIFRLQTNYRSTPEILALANDVISRNSKQFPKELKAIRPSLARPILYAASTPSDEAEYVADQIVRLEREGTPRGRVAVLFRAGHHSQELEFELGKRGIVYDYRGGLKFFERAHIKDAVAFLKLKINPKDQISWLRTLSQGEGIGEATAYRFYERLSGGEGAPRLEDELVADLLSPRIKRGWEDFKSVMSGVLAAASPALAIKAIIDSPYARYLELQYLNAEERLDDLEQLALFARGYKEFEPFLSEITLKDDYGVDRGVDQTDRSERLVLSTIHQAKGLEWDAVFLIRLCEGSFPNPRALGEAEGLEEERRLFYVAVTRARRELYLTYPVAAGYDSLAFHGPSEFLSELDSSLVQEVVPRRGSRPAVRQESGEEDTIELDALGEIKKRPARGLLREVDEL